MDDLEVAFRKPPCLITWDVGYEDGDGCDGVVMEKVEISEALFSLFLAMENIIRRFFSR